MEKCAGTCGLVLFDGALYTCDHCKTNMCLRCSVAHARKIKFELKTVPQMMKDLENKK